MIFLKHPIQAFLLFHELQRAIFFFLFFTVKKGVVPKAAKPGSGSWDKLLLLIHCS